MGLLVVVSLRIVSQSLDGGIGHKVTIVEEQAVNTGTVSKLELVSGVPLVLDIDSELVETDTGSGLELTVVTVSKVDDLRSGTCQEVIEAAVTVVTGTVTHVLVVSHLVLVVDTTHDLVVAFIPGQVVLDVVVDLIDGVVPGEELITESHVVVLLGVVKDVDEGELLGSAAADRVLNLGICGEELVGKIVGQTAVKVE